MDARLEKDSRRRHSRELVSQSRSAFVVLCRHRQAQAVRHRRQAVAVPLVTGLRAAAGVATAGRGLRGGKPLPRRRTPRCPAALVRRPDKEDIRVQPQLDGGEGQPAKECAHIRGDMLDMQSMVRADNTPALSAPGSCAALTLRGDDQCS